MLGRTYENQICSIARALEIVGERWSILILRNAMFASMTRFTDFQRSLEIAPNILSRRLENFVKEGIMLTSKGDSEHLEYHLTPKGLELKPALLALREWGDRWEAPDGAPVSVEHMKCGGRIGVHLQCKKCGNTPKLNDMVARPTEAFAVYQKKLKRRPRSD
ncbi:MAG: winged helix-turn-helix transcriptional regulator [Nitrospiria bacterium]